MRMLRNKAAHLGDAVFRYMALHDRDGRFYTFIPRQWPFIPEQYMHAAGAVPAAPHEPFPDPIERTLMHEDIASYAFGLRQKVTAVISAVLEILDSAYVRFSKFPLNTAALAELRESSESYAFEHFSD